MIEITEQTITNVVIDQMATTPDPRLKIIMESLVRHLHDFAREVSLTPEEWLEGIKFLTAVGHTCTPIRQEFILLSDTLGLSALVNVLHDGRAPEDCTHASNLGPFYQAGSPVLDYGASIAGKAEPDVVLWGRITDVAGAGIPNATLEIWQTDEDGLYDMQRNDGREMDLRATFRTDGEGNYCIRSLLPIGYSVPMDGPVGDMIRAQRRHGYRPAHIHFLVGAEGYREMVTALYLAGDDHIDSDTVFGVSESLVVSPVASDPAAPIPGLTSIRYDFTLARATGAGSGRVGADPSQIVPRAAE